MNLDKTIFNKDIAELLSSIKGKRGQKDFLYAIYRYVFYREEPIFRNPDLIMIWERLFPASFESLKGAKRPKIKDYHTLHEYLIAAERWLDENFDLERYLTPGVVLSEKEKDDFADYYISDPRQIHKWPEEASQRLRQMDYDEFLSTGYWQSMAAFNKLMAGYTFEICGRGEDEVKLHTHHISYLHKGCEVEHLKDLQCICKDCHQRLHEGE